MEFSRIAEYMQASLTGKRLRYITRSCELVDLGLGDIITRRNRFGNDTKVATLSLHLQCPFRITRQSGILIGSDDLFVSSSSAGNVVDLGMQNTCVFDDKLELLHELFTDESVVRVSVNSCGDLSLQLTTLNISVFCTGSTENEMWRFFETGTDKPHIIRTGIGFDS